MQKLIFHPRPIVLDGKKVRREPIRPVEHRSPDFANQFDYLTLVFDSFFCARNEVLIVAPPFFNLLPFVETMEVVALPSQQRCSFHIRNMDRLAQVRVIVPTGTVSVSLRSSIGQFDLEPRQNLSEFFEDKRVIFTISKNTKFQWMQDWIRYNRDIHGADAVLLYDNGSTSYSTEDLLEAVAGVSGIDRVCIVVWPFLFGPQGLDAKHFWDSDFCQHGAWEHARWMFFQHARSVMDSDIDELIVSEKGASVFEAAERSWAGVVRYHGFWVHGFKGISAVSTELAPIRFVNFDHYLRHSSRRRWGIIPASENVCEPKWTVVPRRCPKHAQWTPHRIRGWVSGVTKARDFSFRHFREISNHWKYDRTARETFDPKRYAYDQLICSNYSRVRWSA